MGRWCQMVGVVVCPVCGKIGELKKYRPTLRHKEKKYYRVDHFRGEEIPDYGDFRGKFVKSCYIGRELPEGLYFTDKDR